MENNQMSDSDFIPSDLQLTTTILLMHTLAEAEDSNPQAFDYASILKYADENEYYLTDMQYGYSFCKCKAASMISLLFTVNPMVCNGDLSLNITVSS
jgi:hypothetical protein